MTLDELLCRQKSLNENNSCYPEGADLLWVLLANIQDMSLVIDDRQLRSHEDCTETIAYILCLLLTGCLSEDAASKPKYPDCWGRAWQVPSKIHPIGLLIASIGLGAYTVALMHVVFIAKQEFGCSQNEVEEAYFAVSTMNCWAWADDLEDD